MTADMCGDDRFELIEEAKRRLLESTNIEDRPKEVAVLDSMLFRLWQMGWLDHLREDNGAEACEWCKDGKTFDKQTVMVTNHGWQEIRHCPNCGRKLVSE